MFASAEFARYYGDDDANHQPATVEGGDVHVLGHGAVMIGMGERSTPMAAELLAAALFRAGQANRSSPSSRFAEATGKPAAIGQLGDAQALLAQQAGTVITMTGR